MLINNWYVAAAASDVKRDKPLKVRMLCCDFVLFRDANDKAVCLSDICCHRGASLGRGEMREFNVVCPYHGWEFDGSGRCTLIPALGADVTVPKRVRVDTYPTMEKYGWVWVFLGDLPEAERPVVPDLFPEYDDTANWHRIPYGFEAKTNWMRFEENSLDTAHTNFVHRQFGAKRTPKLQNWPLEEKEWGARVQRRKPAPKPDQKSGEMAKLLGTERADTGVQLEFSLVGLCHRIQPTFKEGMSQINFTARTPVDRKLSRAIGWQARNYLREPQFDAERMAGIQLAVVEDLSVVEDLKPPITPAKLSDEFLTETDSMEMAFRKRCFKWAAKGWEIDLDEFERRSQTEALVIPSPGRRQDPKNWVHKAVPLKPARESTDD
jgi:phenylpropionate dioxygenase-like ring-hydroxylating dioxygenase large terminal subunit